MCTEEKGSSGTTAIYRNHKSKTTCRMVGRGGKLRKGCRREVRRIEKGIGGAGGGGGGGWERKREGQKRLQAFAAWL